jgi:hypothetical protein
MGVARGQAESTKGPPESERKRLGVCASADETTTIDSSASTSTDAVSCVAARSPTTRSAARSGGSWSRWKSDSEESTSKD